MGLVILLTAFFFAMLIGMPIAFALAISALIVTIFEGIPALITFQRMVSGMS